jgi:DNA-binding IclR family transcriptional regulator
MREAVRSQIVGQGEVSSVAIAAALDLPHATVARILQRFAAVGCLRLVGPFDGTGRVEVAAGSLSERFRNLSLPLW